ncbi:hypothetical protein Aperf_G00000131648 [Anoplocephala perfoliata]
MENISKISQFINSLRKSLDWIEEQGNNLSRTSNIFQWKGGLVALVNDIRMQHESIQTTLRNMEKFGSITYRVPCDENVSFKPSLFKARAIVDINKPELGCVIEYGRMYTIVDEKNPFVWKVTETGQEVPAIFLEPSFSGSEERLCEKVQNELDGFKANCLTKVCHILLQKLTERQSRTASRSLFYFPRLPTLRVSTDNQSIQMPQHLRDAITDWIERFGKDQMSWEPVDQFWQWYQTNNVRSSELVESVQLGLRFIEALFQMEICSPTEYYEESGYNETEPIPQSPISNGLKSSFRWNAKLETITNTQQEFSWRGNLHRTNEPMCPKDPRTIDLPAAAATAKAFTATLLE